MNTLTRELHAMQPLRIFGAHPLYWLAFIVAVGLPMAVRG